MSDTLSHVAEDHADADTAFCHWTFDTPGPVRIGSDEHRRMFCRMLLDTHHPCKPAVIDWPPLTPDALARLTSLPIWDMAVRTEGRASVRVRTYAASIREPLLAEALALDAAEEARHKVVLSKLVQAYGIALAPEPDYIEPRDAESAPRNVPRKKRAAHERLRRKAAASLGDARRRTPRAALSETMTNPSEEPCA